LGFIFLESKKKILCAIIKLLRINLKKFLYIFILLVTTNTFATHNRAGEITFTHITGFTYGITVTTYTKANSIADRPNLEVFWGDGTTLDSIIRIDSITVGNNIRKNTYYDVHTYPTSAPAPYLIKIEDPNRNVDLINVPNSVDVVFYLETELYINASLGVNNSPILFNPPIDNACVGETYVHNPGAVDFDGDSLYYSMQPSRREGGQSIPGYEFPQASNSITVNGFTGDLVWDSPIFQGEYNVAILIEEFRNGFKIGSVLRDMQITVKAGCPPPPTVTGIADTCVIAGQPLSLTYNATGDSVELTSTGIPYFIFTPAFFQQNVVSSTFASGNLFWQTACNHVRKNPYVVSVKATDSGPYKLVDFQTTTILVIGPKPENLTATEQANNVNLVWNSSVCGQVTGYKIYRRVDSSGWTPNVCETGVPSGIGFELIATTITINDTTFMDSNNGVGLPPGVEYCYRVVACYPDGAESIASDEACAVLIRDVPIMTRVNVDATAAVNGAIYIEWSKSTEHNTTQWPGPYRNLIYRGEQGSSNMVLIDSTATINDTSYTDNNGLNTQDFQYYYRVDMYNLTAGTRDLMGKSSVASSVFLSLIPSDNQLTLVWNEAVPWTNTKYVIYRQNPLTFVFDSIGITTNKTYVDTGLVNLSTYCYQVMSIGAYSLPGTIDPIENLSEEICGQPIDNVVPCPPSLCVEVNCENQQTKLLWTQQISGCAADAVAYKIYKKEVLVGDYELVTTISNPLEKSYIYDNSPLVGCYVITTIDSVGNESVLSEAVCVDNPNGGCERNSGCVSNPSETVEESCYVYRLPNVFSPGNDDLNDLFQPFPYRFVVSVDIQIFNRWGNLVYWTSDPNILWNGTEFENNKPCVDGTYFYICTVNETCLEGVKPRIIKGFITLLRNN
jgi:gliding motility-associated-like protein